MTVVNVTVGAVTDSSARVVAKVDGTEATLLVDTQAALADATRIGPVTPTADGVATFTATGLDADTVHYYRVEVDGTPDLGGRFRTHATAGEPASFMFAASGDAGLEPDYPGVGAVHKPDVLSNHPVFDKIREHNPLFFLHLGDMHYYNPGGPAGDNIGSDLTAYRRCWDDVMLQPRQHELYRNVPLVWAWDDHDFGPDNSDSTSPGRESAQQVYRERVPHYPLPDDDGGIYHAFQVGRIQFVILDLRSFRTPDAEDDGPTKTMLGSTQKQWLRGLLETSTAQALVLVSSVHWQVGGVDTWGGFATERAEVGQMFVDTGWADRMVMLAADAHRLCFDTGASNEWGGFPTFGLAAMDAAYHGTDVGPYDLGLSGGRDRYGIVHVADTGTSIRITVEGHIGNTIWQSHTFTVDADEPSTPPPSGAPPATKAVPRSHVLWYGCDLVSGRIVAELPELTGAVSRTLGAYTSSNLAMPIPRSGPGALGPAAFQATQPGVTMIVAVVNDVPTWGGIVLTRKGGTAASLQLGCVSLEGYLDRRYVTEHYWIERDQASVIAAGLLADANVNGINLIIDAPPTGVLLERAYDPTSDTTVYSALTELAGPDNGLEWTIDLDWADANKTTFAKFARVRPRIGKVAAQPDAIFQVSTSSVFSAAGSSEATYELTEDYSDGRGANHVSATSSGQGESRPATAPRIDVRPGWPTYERRYSPAASILDEEMLDAHAAADLALRVAGAQTWNITARWDRYPRLNLDWMIGDDVGWELRGHRHADGVLGQGRVIGWNLELQAGTVQPVLWSPDQEA